MKIKLISLIGLLLAISCATTSASRAVSRIDETHEIYEIKSMSEVGQWIIPETLVIFDLDNTLFESKSIVAHANWFHDILKKYPDQEKKILKKAWKAIKMAEYKPVEAMTPDLIKSWQNKGIHIMALTSRDLEVLEPTLRQVKSIGVDFSKTVPRRQKKSKYLYEGILFANNNYPKGEALKSFLEDSDFKPQRIILIDDLKNNLFSVCKVMGAIGLYYPLVDKKRYLEWNEKEAEQLWLLE